MKNQKTINNDVVIIGGDHHNTLALLRCFGKRNIKCKVLIHDTNIKNKKETMIFHSKYGKDIELTYEDEKNIIHFLLKNKNENYKQLIIPGSDIAEYSIDNNYDLLKDYYYIPGFKNKSGYVCKMMDKYEQKKWANKNIIPMARSWLINFNKGDDIPQDIIFPCIIKPNISAFGNKSDIKICNDKEQLTNEIIELKNSNNRELIVQQFLKKDYEICAIGCITSNKQYYGGIIRKIRENPPKGGGSLTFAKFINDEEICKKVNDVLNKLVFEGYSGLYDIEFLVCKDEIFLNEINFRHSGNGYALIKSGLEAPYLYFLDAVNMEIPKNIGLNNKKIYFIDDFNELILLKKGEITTITFIKDFIKAKAHSIFSLSDINVFIYRVFMLLKKRRSKNERKK